MEKQISIKDVIAWCDKLTEEGKEIVLKWDGGGDSGWVYLEVDGEQSSDMEAEWLIDQMYAQLDYGSWAGEFSASGDAAYNAESKSFEGIDYYTETDSAAVAAEIEIRIPKRIYFDTLEIQTEDQNCETSVEFSIRNGFDHPEAESFGKELAEKLSQQIYDAVFKNYSEDDIDSFWANYRMERNEFTEDGQDLVYMLTSAEFSLRTTEDKHVGIYLEDLLEDELEEINED